MAILTSAVHAVGFGFAYASQPSPVLRNVTMDVPEGAFAVMCGGTGSGKTTLLRCMTSALAPAGKRTGTMEVFGSDRPEVPDVGFVMQDPGAQIVCDTVLRELAFGLESIGMEPDVMRCRVAEVATVFGIGSLTEMPTDGLSGGQKQLVNLASVLAMRPKLLLLDEPTAQLDPVSARHLCDALRVVHGQLGLTVIVATHSPELFADLATCAYMLEDGCVSEVPVAALSFEQKGEPSFAEASVGDAEGCSRHSDERISAHDAWFAYERDSQWVLKGIDAAFCPGAVSCIVGGNGCGKTTLLKILAGVLRPRRGKVRNPLIAAQAYLPQDPRLLFVAETVAEELGPLGDIGRELVVGLSSEERALSPLDLSGGQQQMLALAKLLSASPKLLLLDEPVKGLDADAQMHLGALLRGAADEGTAIIMATHDISFASRVADVVVLMFDGKVAFGGSPRSLFEDAAYYKPLANAFTRAWDAEHGKAQQGVPVDE